MPHRSFDDLVKLIAELRGDQGCPWDRAQDHVSLRRFAVEEAHELVAAIDAEEWELLEDELGDLLLQVLLHSQIAAEEERFTIDDVIAGLAAKLIRRHPHVFSDAPADEESIRRTWHAVKRSENRRAVTLPTLIAARKKVEEARAAGRSIHDLRVAASDGPQESRAGWMLLDAVATAVEMGEDPELALRRAIGELDAASGASEGDTPCNAHSSIG